MVQDTKALVQPVLSEDEFIRALPSNIKGRVNSTVMKDINNILNDEVVRETFRENLVSYTSILQKGRFKLSSYIAAVKYVSFKLMKCNNNDAYRRTFPERIRQLNKEGASANKIAAYVSAFNKSKLVNLIWEQVLIPVHILNADKLQKAINHQAYLMLNAKSEKVQCDAAACLIKELRPPEATKIELDISNKCDSQIDELKKITAQLAENQIKQIASGTMTIEAVAKSSITVD